MSNLELMIIEQKEVSKKKNFFDKLMIYSIALLISAIALYFGSANSPIYSFNDNLDQNWFITMGNGLLQGKLPYRDLFEQKGPLLYFVFAFFCLFNPYRMVLLAEILTLSIFLYFVYHIAIRKTNKSLSLIAMLVVAFVVVTSTFFKNHGGSVEEFFLPIIAYMLLCMFEFVEDNKEFGVKRSIAIGVSLGLMFWIKFTTLLLPAIMLIIWLVFTIKRKNAKKAVKSILIMLASFVVVTLPIIIYFMANHCLMDMLRVYIYKNIFGYAGSSVSAGAKRALENASVMSILSTIILTAISIIFMAVGVIAYAKEKRKGSIWYIILVIGGAILQTVIKLFLYYYLVFEVFAAVGVIYFLKLFEKVKLDKVMRYYTAALICSLFGVGVAFVPQTIQEVGFNDYYYPQKYFANEIKNYEIENPSLFCYNMLDFGFYNAAGIVPDEYYFARNNFSYEALPEMFDSFDLAVSEAHADFVVAYKNDYEEKSELFEKYTLVCEQSYVRYKYNIRHEKLTFVLLKKI